MDNGGEYDSEFGRDDHEGVTDTWYSFAIKSHPPRNSIALK